MSTYYRRSDAGTSYLWCSRLRYAPSVGSMEAERTRCHRGEWLYRALDNGSHAAHAAWLPRHHGDPFDRILIAQALVEGLTLVSSDRSFAAYDVPLLT
jgi:hypothetical protein